MRLALGTDRAGRLFNGSGVDPADDPSAWPRRVLVTNDNGIDDIGLVELARALAKVTETRVVAAPPIAADHPI